MKKDEAEARIDELLDAVAEIAREGRCVHCEAIPGAPARDKLFFLPTAEAGPDELKILGVAHANGCPLRGVDHEIQRLIDRFGFDLETKLVEAPPRGVFISGYRTGRRAVGDDPKAMTPLVGNFCDVCGGEGACWRYPCRDFTASLGRSEGPWDVCDRCHGLVESGDLAEMTRLATAKLAFGIAKLNKSKRAQFYEMVGDFQRQFMDGRTGPAQRIER